MTTSNYFTHARTLAELRDEFLSDIRRRLAALDMEAKYEKQASKAAAIGRAKRELESLLSYWLDVELRGAKTRATSQRQESKDV